MGQELARQPSAEIGFAQQIELHTARLLAALSVMEEESRQEMEAGQKVRWAKRLMAYRVEVVESATERWVKGNKFLPHYSEIRDVIEEIMAEEIAKRPKPKA